MAVAINEIRSQTNQTALFFPEIRSFVKDGRPVEERVMEVFADEEIIWMRDARTRTLHGQEVTLPLSRNRFPHLTGLSLTEKP